MLSDVEGKSIKAAKDCSAVESQLQDVQVRCHTDVQHAEQMQCLILLLLVSFIIITLEQTGID